MTAAACAVVNDFDKGSNDYDHRPMLATARGHYNFQDLKAKNACQPAQPDCQSEYQILGSHLEMELSSV